MCDNIAEKSDISIQTTNQQTPEIEEYLEQLSETEKKIVKTAQEILESSFNINKSIGFQEWKKFSK